MVFEINENYVPDEEPTASEWEENTEEGTDTDERAD
jgi:hypothetical protein